LDGTPPRAQSGPVSTLPSPAQQTYPLSYSPAPAGGLRPGLPLTQIFIFLYGSTKLGPSAQKKRVDQQLVN